MNFLSIIIVLFLTILLSGASSAISLEETCPGTLITNMHQKNCTDKATSEIAYYLDRKTCIPKCSIYSTDVQDDIECSDSSDECIAGYSCEQRCGPSSTLREYKCESDEDCMEYNKRSKCLKYCVVPDTENEDEVNCMAYHSNIPSYVDKWWTAKKFKPVCDDHGQWVPKQCKGGLHGRCLCYSSTGVRLFGEALYTEAENMTCACSRRKSELESAGRTYVSFHCDSVGNYEKLQCDIQKGLCWCVEPQTGDLTAPFVSVAAMKKLPCYAEGTIGAQYLRQCESKKFATVMITEKLKTHGVVTVESDTLQCDADGSYGAFSISSGIARCTWRDNSQIENWQTNVAAVLDTLTCNCARDFKVYAHSLACEGNGNYVLLQQVINDKGKKQYYCVDDKGFAKTDLLDDANIDCTQIY
ncbi:uncharacterized protein [Euwallacea fornicatus]|uniref:uncharacterized protein n=1 Tax=Euwallacea fornicatus TaxID=995702 RepID=UPI00338EAC42